MRSCVLVLGVAQFLAVVVAAPTAMAETTKANTTASTEGGEVKASDLALGQPAPTQPVGTQSNPAVARPTTTQAPPQAPLQTVTSPTLASTAVISDGVQTTAVVDIRLLPKQLPYKGEQAIDGYVLDERKRWWMIIAGGALFGIGYVAAVVVGNEHDFDNGFGFTAIPIAGPWISLGMHEEECADDALCLEDDSNEAQLAVSGLLQIAGAVLLPIGIMSTKQVWLRKDLAIAIEPTRIGRGGYGAVINGTF